MTGLAQDYYVIRAEEYTRAWRRETDRCTARWPRVAASRIAGNAVQLVQKTGATDPVAKRYERIAINDRDLAISKAFTIATRL